MTNPTHELLVESPLGPLRLVAAGGALSGLYLPAHRRMPVMAGGDGRGHPVLERARQELTEYFAGERLAFDLPLSLAGTPFQRAVWAALCRIPPGETRSYGQLAAELGGGARAVGSANARNPVSIVVPCHRVVGANGRLTGYAGGEAAKAWLLAHERRITAPSPFPEPVARRAMPSPRRAREDRAAQAYLEGMSSSAGTSLPAAGRQRAPQQGSGEGECATSPGPALFAP